MILSNVGITPWRNELGEENYPLQTNPFDMSNVIQGAWFSQLDNFTPVLKEFLFLPDVVKITCVVYNGEVTNEIAYPYAQATISTSDTIHGCITLGDGFSKLRLQYMGTTYTVNTGFQQQVVYSRNSKSGVFSFAGSMGDIAVNTSAKNHMYWQANGNGVSFDCFSVPVCVANTPLLSINNIHAPNVSLALSDILTWTPNSGGITISLASPSSIKTSA